MSLEQAKKLLRELSQASRNEQLVFLWLIEDTIIDTPERSVVQKKLQELLEAQEYLTPHQRITDHMLHLGFDMPKRELNIFMCGPRLFDWVNLFRALNKEKQEVMLPAIFTFIGFMSSTTAERCLQNIAKEDDEVNDLLNFFSELTTE